MKILQDRLKACYLRKQYLDCEYCPIYFSLCHRRMKHKNRLVTAVIVILTVSVLYIITIESGGLLDTSREDSRAPHKDVRRFGFLQDKVQEFLGIRRPGPPRPDPRLQDEKDIRERMKADKIEESTLIKNMMGDTAQKTESEQAFEREILRKFRRADDNRKYAEVNGRTVMLDHKVDRLFKTLESNSLFKIQDLKDMKFHQLATSLGKAARDKAERLEEYRGSGSEIAGDPPNWERFYMGIRRYSMYDPTNPAINGLLEDMQTLHFDSIEMMEKGTELKLLIYFPDDGRAVFKPMRWGRDYEVLPNHYYFNDFERHHSEIASFHLDRVLGFYRVPPVTGRLVNMTSEIFLLAQKALKKTFYVSPAGNLCFYGDCTYYCDSRHSFCGNGDMIEGSLMTFLPPDSIAERKRWKSPWRRSYSKFRKAEWETNEDYCNGVKSRSPYKDHSGKLLLDIIDMHIFDFITGNMDRHHVELFKQYNNNSFLIHLDNGRGFGKANYDEFSILSPLRQCCLVRQSTFIKLSKLYIGPERLSEILDESLKSDPVYPILTRGHLNAVDRRVILILRTIAGCVEKGYRYSTVIIKDGF